METIDIDFVRCLTRNNFLDENDPNINIKAKLCLRILLFLDSLHDFGDKNRTNDADNESRRIMIKKLLIKLLKDLKWILSDLKRENFTPTNRPYFTMLNEFITNMLQRVSVGNDKTTEQLNENLKIYSIFAGSGNWPDKDRPTYNDIHQKMQQARASPGAVVAENKYFSLIKESLPEVTRLYFYPTYIAEKTSISNTNDYPRTHEDDQQDGHNIHFGIRCLFLSSAPKGGGPDRELHQNTNGAGKLHSYANKLMNYIYQDPNDKNEKYIIFIIACLIFFCEPVTNVESKPHKYIQYDNIALDSYVHDMFFEYIINYSLNCFTIIPTSNHNIAAGAWQFMTSIIQYLCFQIKTNEQCEQTQQQLFEASLNKETITSYNLNTFFGKPVSIIIDAAGKPRSINYLTQCFIDIFKNPNAPVQHSFKLFNTSASKFDAANVSNLEASMKQVEDAYKDWLDTLIDKETYTQDYLFNIKCGGDTPIISIGFESNGIGKQRKYSVMFKQFFSDTFPDYFKVSEDYSSLTKSIQQFGTGHGDSKNNIYFLIAKSMGDFGQILFYYLLQERSGYFNGADAQTSLTIFHTLDTWAASICSLFAPGVICEEGAAAIKIDIESDLPYKYGNNKMFVSRTLRDLLLKQMTPPVDLPTNAGAKQNPHIWSKLPLSLGQLQEWNLLKELLNKQNIELNKELSEKSAILKEKEKQVKQLTGRVNLLEGLFKKLVDSGKLDANDPTIIAELEQNHQNISQANAVAQQSMETIQTDLNEQGNITNEIITTGATESSDQPGTGPSELANPPLVYDKDHFTKEEEEPSAKHQKGFHVGYHVGGVWRCGDQMTRSMSALCQKQQQLNTKINSEFFTLNQQISILEQGLHNYINKLNHYRIPIPNLQDVYTGPITRKRKLRGGSKKTKKKLIKSKYY